MRGWGGVIYPPIVMPAQAGICRGSARGGDEVQGTPSTDRNERPILPPVRDYRSCTIRSIVPKNSALREVAWNYAVAGRVHGNSIMKREDQSMSNDQNESDDGIVLTPEIYRAARRDFHKLVNHVVSRSVEIGGSKSEGGREYWWSILLAKIALSSMTLDKLVPQIGTGKSRQLWDLGSVATLVRVLAENYLMLVWLCVQSEDKAVWDYRITALTIAENRARYRLTAEIEGEAEPEAFVNAQRALAGQLSQMPIFQSLPAGQAKQILRGDKMPFIQDDVIGGLDIDKLQFRRFYRYLSAFVHTGPISFMRVEQQKRGQGEYSSYEGRAIWSAMAIAIIILEAVVSDFDDKWPAPTNVRRPPRLNPVEKR